MSKRLRTAPLPEDEYQRVKNYCYITGQPLNEFLGRLLSDWFRRNQDKVRADVDRFIGLTTNNEEQTR